MIRITFNGGRLILEAPSHPSLRERALALGGRWAFAARVWTFEAAQEQGVRALCRELWGDDVPSLIEVSR